MSRNIVFEGWLTKSPPNKRIWRTKWRRRWFALRQSADLPGQYFLDYYADRNCRRLKGTINLDLCEQVDAGLHMERAGNGTLDPKLRGSVFTIQTQSRTYHLEAETERDMEKWVDAICRVCGLRPTEDDSDETYQSARPTVVFNQVECANTTGPYIPISECITGVRTPAQAKHRAFTFDVRKAQKASNDKAQETRGQIYANPPRIQITTVDSEESSGEDCNPVSTQFLNVPNVHVSRSFTKLAIRQNRTRKPVEGPPVPPRPPKTFATYKEIMQGPRVQEPTETSVKCYTGTETQWTHSGSRSPHYATPNLPGQFFPLPITKRQTEDEDDSPPAVPKTLTYCNLPSMPPAVDRALKPKYFTLSRNHISYYRAIPMSQEGTLQYLDLDLKVDPPSSKNSPRREIRGRSASDAEGDSAYRTVDFLKTEAFNITRQDAEASRSFQN